MQRMQGHIDPTQLIDESGPASEAQIIDWIREHYPNETRITNTLYTVLGGRYLAAKDDTPALGGGLDWKNIGVS